MKLIRSINTPKPGFLAVSLEKEASGTVSLKIKTPAGLDWYVFSINPDGTGTLFTEIRETAGLQVNAAGQIKLRQEYDL